jgi:hypothetical protein
MKGYGIAWIAIAIASVTLVASCDRGSGQLEAAAPKPSELTGAESPPCSSASIASPTLSLTPSRADLGSDIAVRITGTQPYENLRLQAYRVASSGIVASDSVALPPAVTAGPLGHAAFATSAYEPGRYVLRLKGSCGTRARVTLRASAVASDGSRSVANGTDPIYGNPWNIAVSTDACRGIRLRFAYRGHVTSDCVAAATPGTIQPVAYLSRTLIAVAGPHVAIAKLDTYQAGNRRGVVSPIHIDGLPWPELVLVFSTHGADGDLVAYDRTGHEIARLYVGLPPACASPRSTYCFA